MGGKFHLYYVLKPPCSWDETTFRVHISGATPVGAFSAKSQLRSIRKLVISKVISPCEWN